VGLRGLSVCLVVGLVGLGLLGASAGAGNGPAVLPASAGADVSAFSSRIKPILSNRCYKCHGPDGAARQAGLRFDREDGAKSTLPSGVRAIIGGDPDASEMLARITSTDPDFVMPPPEAGAPLARADVEALRIWIADGAQWDRHWSFTAPVRPVSPGVSDESWAATDIDRFVLARLDSEGLSPVPEADRHTLLRRVSLDLTGLPPMPEEVDSFIADTQPGAYERVVDRLLASPAFGERWASVWLDQVRYADTRGYEKDAHRDIWPYRDWVIRAINDDLPFDEFTIEQLAGDLLPEPTQDQILATAMHRNTMNNDEGGTDDEEFRVAAVMDRVETTMQVWMGLTATCARCHTHKYDPITNDEYYGLYAFFNQTEDADRPDESPTIGVLSEVRATERGVVDAELRLVEHEIDAAIDALSEFEPTVVAPPASDDFAWIDDRSPPGSIEQVRDRAMPWVWTVADDGPVHSGLRSLWIESDGFEQSYVTDALASLVVGEGGKLFVHVYVDPEKPTREVMLQFHSVRAQWAHRAYWGENLIAFGADDTPERRRAGDLPEVGAWVRLEIAAADVGLRPGDEIDGWAFSQHGGRVGWDSAGIDSSAEQRAEVLQSQDAWEALVRARGFDRLPEAVLAGVREGSARDEATGALVRRYYLRHVHMPTWRAIGNEIGRVDGLRRRLAEIDAGATRVPIMRELAPDMHRESRVLTKGSFLAPGEPVEAITPAALHPTADGEAKDRLGLAHWIVSRDNPLTARVTVNRVWGRLFETGLVETEEDFGTQGALPSHLVLLDHLATSFMDDGWSFKRLCRRIVLSSTYRQSSVASPEKLERDPGNRLLSRGPRFRLSAEMVRDQALAVSGLLSDKMYGEPVYPAQPEGIWQIVYNGSSWKQSKGEDRHRRALYTYLRRTSPYPSMLTFDAPSREVCVPRRIRTNTPLQALTTLNDPVYVEAAQALARLSCGRGDTNAIARDMLERTLCRPARDAEIERLVALHDSERAHFEESPDEAAEMATNPLGPAPEGADVVDLAAWTVVANVVLNLDELLTRN
jgi:cytochrome c553